MILKKVLTMSAIIALLFPLFAQTLLAGDMTGREIIDRSNALENVQDMEAEMRMEIIRDDRVREREMIMYSLQAEDGTEKSLIRFLSPADVRESGFLNISYADGEDESWLYLPALGRERRMSSEERGGDFMGSDFTNEDMTRTIDDYEYELLGTREINGREVYEVESLPLTDEIAEQVEFARKITYIDAEHLYLHKEETYNERDEMIKELTTENVTEITDELHLPLKMIMRDLENDGKTIISYEEIEVNTGLTADDFTTRALTRPLR